MSFAKSWEKLKVWQESHLYVLEIYKLLETFPKSENFNLTSQIKRAATSIPANIVEGHSRRNVKRVYSILVYCPRLS
ncbi:MAG TPA: four helix bundle protein [Victivallales bacterium]|nr:four helix bundle protein [Victivallales bacterium]